MGKRKRDNVKAICYKYATHKTKRNQDVANKTTKLCQMILLHESGIPEDGKKRKNGRKRRNNSLILQSFLFLSPLLFQQLTTVIFTHHHNQRTDAICCSGLKDCSMSFISTENATQAESIPYPREKKRKPKTLGQKYSWHWHTFSQIMQLR